MEHQSFPGGDKEERTAQLSIAFFAKDKRQKTKNEKDKRKKKLIDKKIQDKGQRRADKERTAELSIAFQSI